VPELFLQISVMEFDLVDPLSSQGKSSIRQRA
jgi:hypothetical protein